MKHRYLLLVKSRETKQGELIGPFGSYNQMGNFYSDHKNLALHFPDLFTGVDLSDPNFRGFKFDGPIVPEDWIHPTNRGNI